MTDEFLTTRQIADTLGYDMSTVQKWIRTGVKKVGKLPAMKLGRDWAVKRDDWEAFLNLYQEKYPDQFE